MKLPYAEGTWFAVPLREGGFAVGLVARATSEGKVILCYFFGPKCMSAPNLTQVENLDLSQALCVLRIGDLSLITGEWPIIGQAQSWSRADWPMPIFIRRDELSRRAWKVYYSDTDPNQIIKEEPVSYDETGFGRNTVCGSGAVELILTKLLS
jgi:hypothetical protein